MKKITRNFIGALFIGGAIATGLVINSTSAFAAELDDIDTQNTVLAENTPQTESTLQSLEDDVETIEQNADAEEKCLDEAKEKLENDTITKETATEILNDGTEIMEQSQELKEKVDENYETVVSETEEAKKDFNEAADNYDLKEDARAVEAAETDEEKIDKLDETAKNAESKHEEFTASHGKESKDYNDVCDEITEWSETVAQFQAEYDSALKDYQELNSKYEELAAYLENYDIESSKYNSDIAELEAEINSINLVLNELSSKITGQGEDYVKAITSLNDVMNDLHKAEAALEDAAAALTNLTQDKDEYNYGTDISSYETQLDNYNKVTELVNQRSEELKKSNEQYQLLKDQFTTQNQTIAEKKQQLTKLQEQYNKWREENPYEEKKSEYDKTGELITDATTNKDNKERSLTFKKNYLTYLENIKNGLDASISLEADNYAAIRDAITRYIEALNDNILANSLKARADESFAKTSADYQELKGIVRDYKSTLNKSELEEIFKNLNDASSELEKAAQNEGTYETQIRESIQQNILTPFKADEIDMISDSVYTEAKKQNQDVHNNYNQLLKKVDEIVQDADPIIDLNNNGTIDEDESIMLNEMVNYVNNIVTNSDNDLNKVANSFNAISGIYTAYNEDVVEVDNEAEYPEWMVEGATKIVVHFAGKIKGNLEKLALAEELEEYLDNIYAISGTFTTTVTDKAGSTQTSIQPIDAMGEEFKRYFFPKNA